MQESYLSETFLKIVDFCKSKDANVKDLLSMLQTCDGKFCTIIFKNAFLIKLIFSGFNNLLVWVPTDGAFRNLWLL
jgi:hypothetical protein